jgi:ribosomal protein S18 acetylase RimI-like enzyme
MTDTAIPALAERVSADGEIAYLADGTPGWIVPLLPVDRETVAREFAALSPESRRRRFLGAVPRLTNQMLDYLVDEVDGIDHVALVLVAETSDGPVPAGIARWVRYRETSTAADVAITVIERWQRMGVATALMAALGHRRPVGVTHLLTEVAADNPASLAMLRRLGPTRVVDVAPGVVEVEVDLDGTGPLVPTPTPR